MTTHEKLAQRARFSRQCVLDAVSAAGTEGRNSVSVAEATGYCLKTVGIYLRMLEAEGAIERSGNKGPATKWGPPGTFEQAQASRVRLTVRRGAGKGSVHRLVNANDAPPIGKIGPASVWDLSK